MQLEYFDDPQSTARPVLLIYGHDPNAAAALQRALEPLVTGDTAHPVQIDTLPRFHGVDGCSLIAQVASSNIGVTRISDTDSSFQCSLAPVT